MRGEAAPPIETAVYTECYFVDTNMGPSRECVQAWGKLLPPCGAGGEADSHRKVSRGRYSPRREGVSLWAWRVAHEREHCAIMEFVGAKPYMSPFRKVRRKGGDLRRAVRWSQAQPAAHDVRGGRCRLTRMCSAVVPRSAESLCARAWGTHSSMMLV
jgi:hypothetical protein